MFGPFVTYKEYKVYLDFFYIKLLQKKFDTFSIFVHLKCLASYSDHLTTLFES